MLSNIQPPGISGSTIIWEGHAFEAKREGPRITNADISESDRTTDVMFLRQSGARGPQGSTSSAQGGAHNAREQTWGP